jgi:hypothetical protein
MNRRELIGAGALVPLVLPLRALAAPSLAEVAWLVGPWKGEGRFMGKPSEAELEAHPTFDDRFLEINWRVSAGSARYQGRGLYRPGAKGWNGQWFDNRGEIRPLTAVAVPDSFRVTWGTAETERGTSSYAMSGDTLIVEDSVFTAQGPRVFATHRLKAIA